MKLGDIPAGEGRAIVVEGQAVAVFRLRDGSVRALGAVCPHRGGPLADGLTDGRVVVCPLHNRAYDLVTGAEVGGDPGVPVHAVTVEPDEEIVVSVAEPART